MWKRVVFQEIPLRELRASMAVATVSILGSGLENRLMVARIGTKLKTLKHLQMPQIGVDFCC